MGIAERLKEERLRIGLSQADFAAAGGAHRKSQGNYESGERFPDAAYLAAIAGAGADVRFIITGQRDAPLAEVLKADERVLLDGYRALDEKTKRRMLAFVLGGETHPAPMSQQNVSGAATQNFHAPVTGDIAGRDIVKRRKVKD